MDSSKKPISAAAAALTREVTVLLEKHGVKVNAKSIMGLLTLEGNHGAKLKIHAAGADAAAAVAALADLFERKFFED